MCLQYKARRGNNQLTVGCSPNLFTWPNIQIMYMIAYV
uniref:Uncharacterized protein n=1 Tax=Arundo donax TaxID=35708 RepID=A0A0A9EAU3_ARUDO